MVSDVVARNHVLVSGAGPSAMLFVHGFGVGQEVWRFVAPAFEQAHRRVVSFDHVGSGRSDIDAYDVEKYRSLHGYAQDLNEICEQLELRDVVCVAHSVGGIISLLASIAAPGRFSKLVLLGSSARYLNDPPDYTGGFERADIDALLDLMDRNALVWASQFANAAMGQGNPAQLTEQLAATLYANDPMIRREFARATLLCDHRADLPRVSHPCLLVQCADDSIVPPLASEYMHRHIAGSTLKMLNGSGHCPHLTHSREVAGAIAEFVGEPRVA